MIIDKNREDYIFLEKCYNEKKSITLECNNMHILGLKYPNDLDFLFILPQIFKYKNALFVKDVYDNGEGRSRVAYIFHEIDDITKIM